MVASSSDEASTGTTTSGLPVFTGSPFDRHAARQLADFSQPEHRAPDGHAEQPVTGAQRNRPERPLQKRRVDNEELQEYGQEQGTPQPCVRKQVSEGALLVRSGIDHVEDLKEHQRGK